MRVIEFDTELNQYKSVASYDWKENTLFVGQKFLRLGDCAQDFIRRHLEVVRPRFKGDLHKADRYAYVGLIMSNKYTPEQIVQGVNEALNTLSADLESERLKALVKKL